MSTPRSFHLPDPYTLPDPLDVDEARVSARRLRDQRNAAIAQQREAGNDLARMEANYQRTKFKALAELIADGMAATAAADVVRGREDVAAARLQRDMAKVIYKASERVVWGMQGDEATLRSLLEWSMRTYDPGTGPLVQP